MIIISWNHKCIVHVKDKYLSSITKIFPSDHLSRLSAILISTRPPSSGIRRPRWALRRVLVGPLWGWTWVPECMTLNLIWPLWHLVAEYSIYFSSKEHVWGAKEQPSWSLKPFSNNTNCCHSLKKSEIENSQKNVILNFHKNICQTTKYYSIIVTLLFSNLKLHLHNQHGFQIEHLMLLSWWFANDLHYQRSTKVAME